MSAHAELAEVQNAIRSARGVRLGELLGAEKRLLEENGAAVMGPLAELASRWLGWFGWREGWLDRLESPPVSSSSRDGKIDPLPRELLTRAIDAGVLDRCRAIAATRWPKRLPAATEELLLQLAGSEFEAVRASAVDAIQWVIERATDLGRLVELTRRICDDRSPIVRAAAARVSRAEAPP